MNNPLVSIIVPIHNVEVYLLQCLDSLLSQSYTDIEVVAVDDGSKDNSWQVLQKYAVDKRLCCVSQTNQGVSAARNKGLELAKGEYVMFVDADDWLAYDAVARCVEVMRESGADVCLFDYMREFGGKSERRSLFDKSREFGEKACQALQCRMIAPVGQELACPQMLDSFGTIWGKLYNRAALKNIKFVDLAVIGTAEDTLFNCFAFLQVRKAVYLHEAFYHYRKYNAGAETKRYKSDLYLRWNKLFEYMSKSVRFENARIALSNRIALSIMGLGLNECMSGHSFFKKKRQLSKIISQPHYREAYRQLDFTYFPIHWKLFFFCAKHQFTMPLLVLLQVIYRIIR